jgi:hypothetical protein
MRQAPLPSSSSSLPLHMPFIQLRRTNGRSDNVFTLIFDEEREEIIMREKFGDGRKNKTQKAKKKQERKVLFFLSHVILLTQLIDSIQLK